MSTTDTVILYRYDGSPFATKVSCLLALKGIPHKTVDVSMVLPRPEITDLLGITYRRIPILAIGKDVYCDSSLIASTIERRFPAKGGYGTLFPPRKGGQAQDIGIQKAMGIYYTDRPLFGLTASTLPFDNYAFTEEFFKDRGSFTGTKFDVKAILARQPTVLSILIAHVNLIEEQLADGREFYLDTATPSYVDVAIFFNFDWITQNKGMDKVLDSTKVPKFTEWLARVGKYLKEKQSGMKGKIEKIDAQAAGKLIFGGSTEPDVVGFDETQAMFLKVKKGQEVSVTPEDTGATHPLVGSLLSLGTEEVVLRVKGQGGTLNAHLPRLCFSLIPAPSGKL